MKKHFNCTSEEKWQDQLNSLQSSYKCLDKYINSDTKLSFNCVEHGEFLKSPRNFLKGQGCPKCSILEFSKRTQMTHDEFLNKSKAIHGDKYEYLSDYIGNKNKILIKCKIHGDFLQQAGSHMRGCGCFSCNRFPKRNIEWLKNKASEINLTCVSEIFIDTQSKHDFICNICNHQYSALASNIAYRKQGCPNCAGKTKDVEWLKQLALDNGGICLSEKYIGIHDKHLWQCKIGHKWESTAGSINQGTWCPVCKESKLEKVIRDCLLLNGLDFAKQHKFEGCKNKRSLPFDFYIPSLNTCIEADGIQHFKLVEKFGGQGGHNATQHNDSIKTKYCQDKGIKLIRIPYWDFKNIEDILTRELNLQIA